MREETRRQLVTGYYLVAFLLLLSIPFKFPIVFVLWFTDPVARVLAALVLLAFLPGAFLVGTTLWLIALVLAIAALLLALTMAVIQWIAGISPIGTLVAIALSIMLAFIGWRALVTEPGPTLEYQLQDARALYRRLVEFFAWLANFFAWLAYILLDHSSQAFDRPPRRKAEKADAAFVPARGGVISIIAVGTGGTMSEEENAAKPQEEGVDPEVVNSNERNLVNPDAAPLPSTVQGYSGWLNESRKRFRLKSRQRTLVEEIAFRSKVIDFRAQDLAAQKVEADIYHFPAEDRIRGKELEYKAGEVDDKLHEQKSRRVERDKPKPEPPRSTTPPSETQGERRQRLIRQYMADAQEEEKIVTGGKPWDELTPSQREHVNLIRNHLEHKIHKLYES